MPDDDRGMGCERRPMTATSSWLPTSRSWCPMAPVWMLRLLTQTYRWIGRMCCRFPLPTLPLQLTVQPTSAFVPYAVMLCSR